MKVIIAGSSSIFDPAVLEQAIEASGFHITTVISGRCQGVDILGERWAERMRIPVLPFPANWRRYGRSAGPIRNLEMAKQADAVLVVWDGQSPGAKNMQDIARDRKMPLHTHIVEVT